MHQPSPVSKPGRRGLALRRKLAAACLAGIVAFALGGCGSSPSPAFDLSAPRSSRLGARAAITVIPEPSALQPFETERVVARDTAGTLSILPDGQWADRLPRLVQTRLIQAFENSSRSRSVSRPGDGITADNQLTSEIRTFLFDARTGEAAVEISAKLVDLKSGRVVNARIFSARTPVASAKVTDVAPALDRSASNVFLEIIRWVGSSPSGTVSLREPALRTGSL